LIHFVAHHGLEPDGERAMRETYPLAPGRRSTIARSILNAAVEQIPDVLADADYAVGALAHTITARSITAVPMLKDGRPIGAVAIARSEPGNFPSRQVELLQHVFNCDDGLGGENLIGH
jgi:two-component system, NtrC family, sensor kinase